MENVSIRDYMDDKFEHVDQRFDRLEKEVRANRNHTHGNYVTWGGLLTVLGILVAASAVIIPLLV